MADEFSLRVSLYKNGEFVSANDGLLKSTTDDELSVVATDLAIGAKIDGLYAIYPEED